MITCPFCDTICEPWQVYCHDCGQSVSSFEVPMIQSDIAPGTDLIKAYRQWMRRGKLAMKSASFDEAQACFAEAMKRVHGLEKYRIEEIQARRKLAEAFLRLAKLEEALEQLVRANSLCGSNRHRAQIQESIDQITAKLFGETGGEKLLRAPREMEYMTVPLHCGACNRLLSESEVYKFRAGTADEVVCACTFRGIPLTAGEQLTRNDDLFATAFPLKKFNKAKLIEAAQMTVPGGRKKKTAFWLALLTGAFGGHKFYLGDTGAGYMYAALCWTFIPLLVSIYEAIHIIQMSRVSFNLAYNIEEVLKRMPLDSDAEEAGQSGVFSMVIASRSEDPLEDEWSSEDEH